MSALTNQILFVFQQDEDITYNNHTDDQRGATAAAAHTVNGNDSADENDVDESTISGENDVEYAEFSMSLQMSPKERPSTATDDEQHRAQHDDNTVEDDFMTLTGMSDDESTLSVAAGKLQTNFHSIYLYVCVLWLIDLLFICDSYAPATKSFPYASIVDECAGHTAGATKWPFDILIGDEQFASEQR